MAVPKVAIVGRPNVGKSSLLNWLAHKRISVVDPMAGVTRDRVTYLMQVDDRFFELVDTGGIGIVDRDDLSADVEHQIQVGINQADLIIFVVDGQAGITALDQHVSQRLRKVNTPKIIVVNKCDSPKLDAESATFFGLADGPLITTSIIGNRNQADLLKLILKTLPGPDRDESEEGARQAATPELKLAIVGRRNVGKSTFINQLAETERMIVSEVAGTTRDSVDIRFELDGKSFIAIDTPGVRKRKSLANDVEWYGLARARRSIRRANVVFMFFDATQTISRVDKQLVTEIQDEYKACIFVINKWDLVPTKSTEEWTEYFLKTFAGMNHVPLAFITAKDGRNIKKLINLAQSIYKQSRHRVGTGELNRVVRAAVKAWPPPMRQNRNARILFATQVATEPPTMVLKVNEARLFDESWKRYLLRSLREQLPFAEVPIKLYLRSRNRNEEQAAREEAEIAAAMANAIEDEQDWTDPDDILEGIPGTDDDE